MTEQRKTFIPDENETIIQMEIERLKTFKDHPFKVENDDEMKLLKESIEKYGVLNPLIVRPLKEGVYEIISGHRRKFAAEELGYRKVPVIIRVMKDEESIIVALLLTSGKPNAKKGSVFLAPTIIILLCSA